MHKIKLRYKIIKQGQSIQIIITTFNMHNPRPKSLTELIHFDTKDFLQQLRNEYKPHFINYSHNVYNKLIQCYQTHITQQALQNQDSNAMLAYYSCYKGVLRQAKAINKRLHDVGLQNEKKLKHCLQIRSNFSKSNEEFQERHDECIDKYKSQYQNLYTSIFKQFIPNLNKQQ